MARALTRPTALDLLAAPARASSLSPLDQPARDAVADFARRIDATDRSNTAAALSKLADTTNGDLDR